MNNLCHSAKRRYALYTLAVILLTVALMHIPPRADKASATEGAFTSQTPGDTEGCTDSVSEATTEGVFTSQTPCDTAGCADSVSEAATERTFTSQTPCDTAGCTESTSKATAEGAFTSQTPCDTLSTGNESLDLAEDELADAWERFIALLPPEISDTLLGQPFRQNTQHM